MVWVAEGLEWEWEGVAEAEEGDVVQGVGLGLADHVGKAGRPPPPPPPPPHHSLRWNSEGGLTWW